MLTYADFCSNLCNSSDLNSNAAEDILLCVFHPPQVSRFVVVEPVQMQEPVHDIQLDLADQRITEFAGIAPRCFDTDKNFAVMKGYDVGHTVFAEKLEVQSRDAPIGDEPYFDCIQFAKVSSFALLQLQTTLQRTLCEVSQVGNVQGNFSLTIVNENSWHSHRERSQERLQEEQY